MSLTAQHKPVFTPKYWQLLLIAILGSAWIWTSRVPAADANPNGRPPAAQAGHPAPNFELQTADGEVINLSAFRGTPVVLNFWASWCGPCRAEMPAFQLIADTHAGKIAFIGVNTQDQIDRMLAFAAEVGVTYPLPIDTTNAVTARYRVNAFPTTYFIDADGVIVDMVFGGMDQALLEAKVLSLIEE